MEPIIWSEKLSVGIKKIDLQHQRLIEMINRLITSPDLIVQSEKISDILTEMTRYAGEHFNTEEELMAEYDYPLLEKHKAQHREFRKKTVDLCKATAAGVESVPQVLFEFLNEWFHEHFLQEDMKYKNFFAQRGVR